MKKFTTLLFIALFITQLSISQVYQWTGIIDTVNPTAVFFDENDSLWFATNDGKLFMKNGNGFDDYSSGIICNNVTSADEDEGVIWVGGYNVLTQFDGSNYTDYTYDADPQVSDLASYAIYDLVAKNGKVWLAMEMGEISYFNGTGFTHYTTADGLSEGLKLCIEQDELGQVWAGGSQWHNQVFIDKYDGSSWTNYSSANGLTLNSIHTIFEDSQGNIWAAGDKLMKFNGLIWVEVPTPLADISALEEDKQGRLWLAGNHGDVYIYDGDSMIYAQNPVKYGFRPDGMAINKKGKMYLCMDGGVYMVEEVPGTPPLKANFTVSDVRPCQGIDVQFTDLSTGNPTSWKWYFGDGDSSSLQHPVHQYSDQHYQDVTLIVGNGSTYDTLVNDNAIYVDNNGDDPTIVINGNEQQVCDGDTVTFMASVTDEGNDPAYEWFINDTSAMVDSTGSYSFVPGDGDKVQCILTSSSACVSVNKDTSNIVYLSVLQISKPHISITAIPGNNICDGDRLSFTSTVQNAGSFPGYQWKLNGTDQTGETGIHFSSSSLQDGDIVSCEVNSSLGCAVTPAVSNEITMNVGQSGQTPVITISALPSDTLCTGEQVIFSSQIQYGGSNPAYQWKINGVDTAGQTNSSFIVDSLNDEDQITCELTSSSSCVSTPNVISNTIDIGIVTSVTPNIPITANPSGTVCLGTNVQFTANPVNGGTSPSYQWKLNGADVGTGQNTYSSSLLSTGDTLSCVLTSSSACATGPAVSNDIVMDMTLTLNTAITEVNSNTLSVAETGADYQWISCNNGNQPIAGANNQTFTPVNDGNYAVYVTKNGCTELSGCFNWVHTNIATKNSATEIKVFPNPTRDNITLVPNKPLEHGKLYLTNISGQLVFEQKYHNIDHIEVNMQNFNPGIYFIHLVSEKNTMVKNVLKTE